jgi:hypothetical protein
LKPPMVLCVLWATLSTAAETTTLPKGAFNLDMGYLYSSIDKQWSGERKALPLIEAIPRYEPGAGLQGILSARPQAEFHVILFQLFYGITERLTAGIFVPIVLETRVQTNLSWAPGDFQSALGRSYSEDDFWAWAQSLGQPRVPQTWKGNSPALSDIVLAGRYLLPEFEWMTASHFRWTGTLQVALPTGKNFDPEEAVSVGTNLWELHSAGDVEAHLSADKAFWVDAFGVAKLSVGADVGYAFLRPREYAAGQGTRNPLLNNVAPYVGNTYIVDGGDWLMSTLSLDFSPLVGPTRASMMSGNNLEAAQHLPPLATLSVGVTHVRTLQSDWRSQSALWDWDKEKYWQPGDKTAVKGSLTVSLFRLGLPLQLYAQFRNQDVFPGRFTRPANVYGAGIRVLFKFW